MSDEEKTAEHNSKSLLRVMNFGAEAIEKAKMLCPMMRHDICSFKPSVEMYLTNTYNFKFEHLASAFLRIQINENTRFIRTTIPHIS